MSLKDIIVGTGTTPLVLIINHSRLLYEVQEGGGGGANMIIFVSFAAHFTSNTRSFPGKCCINFPKQNTVWNFKMQVLH
jgi:hypothetical protein